MHKTKNTYLFEREYDKENSGVVDEALKRYWTNILGIQQAVARKHSICSRDPAGK